MLKELVSQIILEELKKELTGNFSELIPTKQNTINHDAPLPRGNAMIDIAGPLFFSPEEQLIINLLNEKGPLKQAQIIENLSLDLNANTVKELLANLIRRRVLFRGSNGYEVIPAK